MLVVCQSSGFHFCFRIKTIVSTFKYIYENDELPVISKERLFKTTGNLNCQGQISILTGLNQSFHYALADNGPTKSNITS